MSDLETLFDTVLHELRAGMTSSEIPLLTIVQISDLHFWPTIDGSAQDPLSSWIISRIKKYSFLEGMLGHHYKAVAALHDFCSQDEFQNNNTLLVMTGDLTATGAPAEFALAADFLDSGAAPFGFGFGLGRQHWADESVSGNHDNFPGNFLPIGLPTPALRQYFPQSFPVIGDLIALPNGDSLRFIYVDSDKDVGPFSFNRVMARGCFETQLDELRVRLDHDVPPIGDSEIRVLVVHHAITRLNDPIGAQPFTRNPGESPRRLEIEPVTLRALEHLLVDFDIKVVLSGHLHLPRLTHLAPTNGMKATEVLEARCGTTTQIDRPSYRLVSTMGPMTSAPNTLLVHRLVEVEGATVWRSKMYMLGLDGRFAERGAYLASLQHGAAADQIVVLPRP